MKPIVRELYRVAQLPLFQNRMYDSEAEALACPKGDLCLVEDLNTGLVYNILFDATQMQYDAHYQNEQAVSPFFQQHLATVAQIVARHLGKSNLVEVGCGKGHFLEMLVQNGFDIAGFDPTYEGENPRIARRYFEPDIGIEAKGLILRHVLEHVENPIEFLLRLRAANKGAGLIYIEVPCFDWICEHRAWFDIYYEHVNYFRLSDFHRLFGRVIESGRLFNDQYLYVVAELNSLRTPAYDAKDAVVFPHDMLQNLGDRPDQQNTEAVWGGASKGVIFTLLRARRSGRAVDAVIDINPAKQGKYLPASGLRVSSPAEALARLPVGATLYLMNSNYLEEIKALSNHQFNYVSVDHE